MSVAKLETETVDCPVCGPAPSRVWLAEGKPTRYLRCRQCATIYASPRASHAARLAWLNAYFGPGEASARNEASRRPALEQEAAILRRYVPGGRLLDVGCDLGAFFAGFPEPAWQRFGVELSPAAAAHAAQAYNAQVYPGTLHQAGCPAGHFDLVTMIDMFSYVDAPRADLCEAARVLKPGGWLAMEIPGQAWAILRGRGVLCWLVDRRWTRLHSDSTYLYWYSVGGLRTLLAQTGFTVVGAHVIGSPASANPWRNRLTEAHRRLMTWGVQAAPGLLAWAPKYLVVARRAEAGATTPQSAPSDAGAAVEGVA